MAKPRNTTAPHTTAQNNNAQEMSGADMIVRAILDQGTDTVFGYPGGAILPVYDSIFRQNRLRHILVRHEQAAAHAAEGYARSTGKVGAAIATSGPGATNLVTGLTDALMDSVPIVCITGQVPLHLIGSDAFQEADVTGITRACTKYNYLVREINDLGRIIHEAFHVASSGRPGPVLVDVPKNVLNETGTYRGKSGFERPSYNPQRTGDARQIEKAVALMATAKRPVFYVGGGLINAGPLACEALTAFVRMTGFPITTTLMGLGAFPGDDPQSLKMLGMHGTMEANMAMHDCDVMICIGARFDDRVTGKLSAFSPKSKKIHVDIDASSIDKNVAVNVPIVGDAGVVIKQMIDAWKALKPKIDKQALASWWKQIDGWRSKNSFGYKPSKTTIKPQYALERLNFITKGQDAYITTDVGQHQMWAAQFMTFERPGRWMTSGGLGTMGYGLPCAMGVQIAHPDKPVVCITGDASILMNIQELSTIKQYNLPVKILILNNSYMGMVRQWQEVFYDSRYSESYTDSLPDFVKLAESFGIKGLRANKPSEVDKVLKEMLAHKGPVLVDMAVEQVENVYPMIPAGAAHNEIILSPEGGKGRKLDSNQV